MSIPRQNLVVVALIMSVVIFCSFSIALFIHSQMPTKINYRLTLKVEANGIVYTGSGVIESVWYPGNKFIPIGNDWNTHVKGEAVVVDLGERGTLFALLTGSATPLAGGRHGESFYPFDADRILLKAFNIENSLTQDSLNSISKRRDSVDLPLNKLPMLVRFNNLNDPSSVERVDPNDLPTSFGLGVRIVSATFAVTDDPVTTGIEKKLVWLQTPNDGFQSQELRLNNELRSRRSLTGNLAIENFKRL